MTTRREFLQSSAFAGAAAALPFGRAAFSEQAAGSPARKRPNIVFILADDMGFSDIGCYGSEIETPNLDALARGGLRFTDFHNCPRCCPSRAALLTGLYSHQVGMGLMTSDHGTYPFPAYAGDLSEKCVTIAEALKAGGYSTLMAGKWHLTPLNVGKHNYPLQRGFDRYYGIINGAASYFDPASLTSDNDAIEVSKEDKDYYFTNAIGDKSVQFIGDAAEKEKPFFLYAAFTAGHWPLMAPEETIAKYKGKYAAGWDALRASRHAKQAPGLRGPAVWSGRNHPVLCRFWRHSTHSGPLAATAGASQLEVVHVALVSVTARRAAQQLTTPGTGFAGQAPPSPYADHGEHIQTAAATSFHRIRGKRGLSSPLTPTCPLCGLRLRTDRFSSCTSARTTSNETAVRNRITTSSAATEDPDPTLANRPADKARRRGSSAA